MVINNNIDNGLYGKQIMLSLKSDNFKSHKKFGFAVNRQTEFISRGHRAEVLHSKRYTLCILCVVETVVFLRVFIVFFRPSPAVETRPHKRPGKNDRLDLGRFGSRRIDTSYVPDS